MKKTIGFSYSNRNKGNKKTASKVSPDKRRRIGYKHFDNVNELPAIPEIKDETVPANNFISTAHNQLIEKISGITSLVLSNAFSKLSPAEKTTYISLLISNVALEAELSATKTLAKK